MQKHKRPSLPNIKALATVQGFVPEKELQKMLRVTNMTMWRWQHRPYTPRNKPILPAPEYIAGVRGWQAEVIRKALNIAVEDYE